MKLPEGGGFLRGVLVWLGKRTGRVTGKHPGNEGRPAKMQKPRLRKKSVAQLELLGNGLVTADVLALQIFEQAAALTDHHQQPAAGAVVFLVGLQMFRQMVDPLREQRDLDIGRAGVFNVQFKLFNRLCLGFHIN
jgi:hypothetical protein